MIRRGPALIVGAFVLIGAVLSALAVVSPIGTVMALGLALVICLAAILGTQRLGYVALVVAFLTAPMYRGIGGVGPITPTDASVFFGIALILPHVAGRRFHVPPILTTSGIVLTGLGLTASVVVNQAPISSMIYVVQWLVMFIALPVFLLIWRPSARLVDGLLWAYLVGQVASTLDALAGGAQLNGRYQGFASHANDFGLAGAVAAVAVMYLLPRQKHLRWRVLLLFLGVVSLYSIVMSGSRGSTLAVALVIALVPIVERSGVWAALWTLGGTLGLALLPFLLQIGGKGGSLARLTGDSTAATSDSQRTDALADGWHRFIHQPFIGYGIDPLVGEYHNLFLEVAVAVGIFGVVAYLAVCYLLCRPAFTRHPMRRLSYLPWLFVVAGISFPGLVDRTIVVPMALAILAYVPSDETVPTPVLKGPRRQLVPS